MVIMKEFATLVAGKGPKAFIVALIGVAGFTLTLDQRVTSVEESGPRIERSLDKIDALMMQQRRDAKEDQDEIIRRIDRLYIRNGGDR